MKNIIYIFLFAIAACTHTNSNDNQSQQATDVMTYGTQVNLSAPVDITEMTRVVEEQDSARLTVEGKIVSTCKMKGCWMSIALPEGEEMRVTFKDYSFFVPKEGVEGKTAVFEGWAKREVVTEKERRHYAADAGKSKEDVEAIKGDSHELTFVADGVVIKN